MAGRTDSGAFNWTVARQRLERAALAMREAVDPPAARIEEILRQRARKLARPLDAAAIRSSGLAVVKFRLGPERYAIDCDVVRAIVRLRAYTAVPGTAPHLLGVTNHRGTILPVIDLHRFFGLQAKGISDLSHLVVVGRDGPEFGLLVDALEDLDTVDVAELSEPSRLGGDFEADLVRGIGEDALIVLHGRRLLADPRLANARA